MKETNENLMSDRSVNIILITKRFDTFKEIKQAIALYMSEECICPIAAYTDSILFNIVEDVMFDFFHHASERHHIIAFTRTIVESDCETMLNKMLLALSLTRVADVNDGKVKYINGWHDTDFTKKLDANEWILKWKAVGE